MPVFAANHPVPPRRIAFLELDFGRGGSLTCAINLAGEFVRRGLAVQIVCLHDRQPPPAEFARLGIPTTSESSRRIFEDRAVGALEKLKQFRPDVVVASMGVETCEGLRYLPPGVRRVGVIHAEIQMKFIPDHGAPLDCVVTVSERNRDFLAARFGSRLRIECVEPGIPLPAGGPRLQRAESEPLRVLYLGRLEDDGKRVRLFPAIFERLKNSGIPFVWTIAGEGPERQFLEENMKPGDDRQRVVFKGLVPYSEVPALLAEHDILLLTSDLETFSLSLHEGMAAGLVPVVSDLPGRVGRMVTPERGIRVPVNHVDGYADAIIRLHRDRKKWRRMSLAAMAAIGPECSVEAMADRWLAILPPVPETPVVWPVRWKLQVPRFAAKKRWWFSPPMRALRRLAARVHPPSG